MTLTEIVLEAPDKEAAVKRNPHKDFGSVQASREPYDQEDFWEYLKSPNTQWKIGDGANTMDWKKHEKISVDPNDPGRQSQYYIDIETINVNILQVFKIIN